MAAYLAFIPQWQPTPAKTALSQEGERCLLHILFDSPFPALSDRAIQPVLVLQHSPSGKQMTYSVQQLASKQKEISHKRSHCLTLGCGVCTMYQLASCSMLEDRRAYCEAASSEKPLLPPEFARVRAVM